MSRWRQFVQPLATPSGALRIFRLPKWVDAWHTFFSFMHRNWVVAEHGTSLKPLVSPYCAWLINITQFSFPWLFGSPGLHSKKLFVFPSTVIHPVGLFSERLIPSHIALPYWAFLKGSYSAAFSKKGRFPPACLQRACAVSKSILSVEISSNVFS